VEYFVFSEQHSQMHTTAASSTTYANTLPLSSNNDMILQQTEQLCDPIVFSASNEDSVSQPLQLETPGLRQAYSDIVQETSSRCT